MIMGTLSFDDLLAYRDAGEPIRISIERARYIVSVQHSLTDPEEFQSFMDLRAKRENGTVCAASLYEWLGY